MNLRLEGDAAAAKLIREVAFHSSKNVNVIQKKARTYTPYTEDEALAMIIIDQLINQV